MFIGHVHLKVADLERAIGFYHGVLGFDVMQRLGDSAAFLSWGGYHHHIGLNTWESLVVLLQRAERPVCIIRRSFILTGRRWPTLSEEWSRPESIWMARRIMG